MSRKHEYHYSEDGLNGHFTWNEKEISEDNPFDHSIDLGQIILDFKDGRIAGIEVLPPASEVIDDNFRKGSIEDPEEIEINTAEEIEDKSTKGENQSSGENDAYEDRNLAVLAYLKAVHDWVEEVTYTGHSHIDLSDVWDSEPEYGWKEADDEDDDWVIVWIEDEHGQKAWHIPRELVEDLDWLPKKHVEWDGHTREEKNDRLRAYIGLGQKNAEGDNTD